MPSHHALKLDYHYLHFKMTPPTNDILTIRKTVADCLLQSFGSTMASTRVDILWIQESDDASGGGKECIIRTHVMDAKIISAAITAVPAGVGPRLSLIRDSPFLPSLLRGTPDSIVAAAKE